MMSFINYALKVRRSAYGGLISVPVAESLKTR
jgi:hypothetical protein